MWAGTIGIACGQPAAITVATTRSSPFNASTPSTASTASSASTASAAALGEPAAAGRRVAPAGVALLPDCEPAAAAATALSRARPIPSPSAHSLRVAVDAYKLQLACRLHARNASRLYRGAPPPMLKSVTVLQLRIDGRGALQSMRVLRSNGYRDLDRVAMQSVRAAFPLPAPASGTLKHGSLELVETWLFRDDGRFQLRTLAGPQADANLPDE